MKKKKSPKVIVDSWHGCYPSDWRGTIIQESTAHPAKYSSRLIERIYEHLSEMGWVEAGDSVVDPFAGVGLGALHALRLGLHWTGIELENRWFELAFESYACPGFDKEFWVRFAHRPGVIQYLRSVRRLCPVCESRLIPSDKRNKAGKIIERIVPFSDPHIYMGNIPNWDRKFSKMPKWGSARLFNGDSRMLSQILKIRQTVAISSPPFGNAVSGGGIEKEGYMSKGGEVDRVGDRTYQPGVHGQSDGNLANLKISEEAFRLSLSSPHKADSINSGGNGIDWSKVHLDYPTRRVHDKRIAHNDKRHSGYKYGETAGQLGSMKSDPESFDASIASPPFLQSSGGLTEPKAGGTIDQALHKRHSAGNKHADAYGDDFGQLTNMPEGDFDKVISSESFDVSLSSPPYADGDLPQAKRDYSKLVEYLENKHNRKMKRTKDLFGAGDYGRTGGQLGAMPVGDFDVSLASPPYAGTTITTQAQFKSAKRPNLPNAKDLRDSGGLAIGETTGNLGSLPTGDPNIEIRHTVAISSPPYENSISGETIDSSSRRRLARASGKSNTENVSPIDSEKAGLRTQTYGITDGNMGNEAGENFWSAARVIVEQVYENLKPGGHSVWVVKDYVRSWEVVPFCDQWRRLCEAVGFVTLHEHHAELNRHKGTHYTLDGGKHVEIKSSKGFFRRLREAKGSPAIDFEVVFCMVKPEVSND